MCGLGVMFALYRILLGMQRGCSIEIQDRLPFLGLRICAGYFHAGGPLPGNALPPGRIQGRVFTRIASYYRAKYRQITNFYKRFIL